MSDSVRNLLVKVVALLALYVGLTGIADIADTDLGWFIKPFGILLAAILAVGGIGFWRRRRWAFLVVSLASLVLTFAWMFLFFLSFDAEDGSAPMGALAHVVAYILVIAFLCRWETEKLFLPAGHAH